MKLRFFHCNVCGKNIAVLSKSGIPTYCCGQSMTELIPNKTDGASEKHVPVFSVSDDYVSVKIGSAPHPMTEEHFITWIGLCTDRGFLFKELKPGDLPEAGFLIGPGEKIESVFAYCNIHGLWSVDISEATPG